jgi:adenine phosphoribosyltransferase
MDDETAARLRKAVRTVKDFPKEGVKYFDITTLLKEPEAFRQSVKQMAEHYADKRIDVIASTESRGFIFGSALAYELGVGFVPIRKQGKLPHEIEQESYGKEYGTDTIEIHKDAINPGQNVLLVDDLLATGGTINASAELVKRLGGKLAGFCFLIELSFLNGREKLKQYGTDIYSILRFES